MKTIRNRVMRQSPVGCFFIVDVSSEGGLQGFGFELAAELHAGANTVWQLGTENHAVNKAVL